MRPSTRPPSNPRPRLQAKSPAYLIFATDVGPILVMDALACGRFPPDARPVLRDQIGFDLSGLVHFALEFDGNEIDLIQVGGNAHFPAANAAAGAGCHGRRLNDLE